jgi:phosphohistidine phosphatase
MFELMLMRHAKSDWHSHTADIDRPLNKRGLQDATQMGQYLEHAGLVPDCMIVSGARRTRQTADLLLENLNIPKKQIIVDKELYLADRETLQEVSEVYLAKNKRLMLIAHNPGMDDFVSYLASEPPKLSSSGKLMVTCAVACLRINDIHDIKSPGRCELLRLLRPKEISAN